jgi:uncharacterized protein (DUF697 family)
MARMPLTAAGMTSSMGALQMIAVVLCVVGGMWVIFWGSTWLVDRGRIAQSPLLESSGKLMNAARQNEVYERRVEKRHMRYLRLRRGLPWALGVLVLGVALAIIASH